jgi:predicted aspartyl protease
MKRYVVALLPLFLMILSSPANLQAELYEYRDKNGKLFFVDDLSKIPPEYRKDKIIHGEKYDDLPAEEKREMLARDQRELEAYRKKEEKELKEQRAIEVQLEALRDRQRKLEILRRKMEKNERRLTTRVNVRGNSVIVPAKLAYGYNLIEASLIHDTGAELTLLHKDVADQLEIDQSETEPIRLTVVGGKSIYGRVARLDYLEVGPVVKKDLHVAIIPYRGPHVEFDGLLGMDFLKGLTYSINFEKRVMSWMP